ncbi:MAG: nucleotidyltransferase [Gammaproteobacteria bacterium]
MHPLIETHRDAILDIARRYGPPGVSGLALGGLSMDVQDITGRTVDVLTDGGLNPALRDFILKKAQAL